MAFTYDLSKLSEEPLFQVRFQISDTVEGLNNFDDEEIKYLLEQNNNNIVATSIACCDRMLSKLANAVDYSLGPYSENGSDARYNRWLTLKRTLQAAQSGYSAPISEQPTTEPIFQYDMMSTVCCDRGDSNG